MEMKVDMEALLKTFNAMPDKIKLRAARYAMRQGAAVVKKAAERNIQGAESSEASHTLEKSLQVFRMKEKNGLVRYGVRIKPKSVNARKRDGQGKPVRVGLYAAVLEYGGKVRKQPAWSWLRRAAKEHISDVVAEAREGFKKNLDKAVNEAKGQ